jgi:uncharacterized protein YndB with AHSA1/START domain
MPGFDQSIEVDAPPEEVWKLLYDPARFPEWMEGIARVADRGPAGEEQTYTQYVEGYPEFPMPQRIQSDREAGRVVISCLVSFLEFRWTLTELAGDRTAVAVHVEIPPEESARLADTRAVVGTSLQTLGALAGPHPLS